MCKTKPHSLSPTHLSQLKDLTYLFSVEASGEEEEAEAAGDELDSQKSSRVGG